MRKSVILSKLFATLGAALVCAPVFLILGAAITPYMPEVWLIALASSLLLACFVRALPRKKRVLAMILCVLLSLAIPVFIGWLWDVTGLSIIFAVLSTAVMIVHLSALLHNAGEEYLAPVWYVGIMFYLLCRLLTISGSLRPARATMDALGAVYFVYILFALNEQALLSGMGGGRAPSRLMRWRNRLTMGILALVLVVTTNLPAIKRAMAAFLDLLRRGVLALLEWLSEPVEEEMLSNPSAAGGPDLSGLAEIKEPSALLKFLEQVMRVVALVAVAAIVSLLLWYVGKRLVRVVKLLIKRLREYAGQVNEAYEDTVESLLDWGEVKRALQEKSEKLRVKRKARTPWEKLNARERVRRVYEDYLREHPELPVSTTARRALRDKGTSGALYDRARYSTEEITLDEAERMRSAVASREGEEK